MENPFEVISTRISKLENMIIKLTNIVEETRTSTLPKTLSHDRKSPATRKLAAEYLGVSVPTVDLLVKSKQLRPTRIGRAVRFTWDELDAFISKRSK